jgi:hypothetical protein
VLATLVVLLDEEEVSGGAEHRGVIEICLEHVNGEPGSPPE